MVAINVREQSPVSLSRDAKLEAGGSYKVAKNVVRDSSGQAIAAFVQGAMYAVDSNKEVSVARTGMQVQAPAYSLASTEQKDKAPVELRYRDVHVVTDFGVEFARQQLDLPEGQTIKIGDVTLDRTNRIDVDRSVIRDADSNIVAVATNDGTLYAVKDGIVELDFDQVF